MKFGKRLIRERLPQWSQAYVDYKSLKTAIKATAKILKGAMGTAEFSVVARKERAAFFSKLDAEIEKVSAFYDEQEHHIAVELEHVNSSSHFPGRVAAMTNEDKLLIVERLLRDNDEDTQPEVNEDETSSVLVRFVRTSMAVSQLKKFAFVNHLAFVKIVKKFEKKTALQLRNQVLDKVMKQKFYSSSLIGRIATQIECQSFEIGIAPSETFEDSFTCPICLEMLEEPVVLSCAHRFCWKCISSEISHSLREWACSICRKKRPLDPSDFVVDAPLRQFLAVQHYNPYASPYSVAQTAPLLDEASGDFSLNDANFLESKGVVLEGHRGAPRNAPENTLRSFQTAIDMGATSVEFDVRKTVDDHLIVFHGVGDEGEVSHLIRGHSGNITNMTLKEVQCLDVLDSGDSIPTLDQVLDLCRANNVRANIEIKSGHNTEIDAVEMALEKGMGHRCVISAFDHQRLRNVKKLYPEVRVGALFDAKELSELEVVQTQLPSLKAFADILHICWKDAIDCPKLVDMIHAAGMQVMTWIPMEDYEKPSELEDLLSTGVDCVCTNQPDLLATAYDKWASATATTCTQM